jgi:hypothetical protein
VASVSIRGARWRIEKQDGDVPEYRMAGEFFLAVTFAYP